MVKIHKVIVVGDKQTGKTSLIMKYLDGVFPTNPQLDSSSKRKEVTIGNENGYLDIWDTCKGEQRDSLSRLFFRKAEVALCVFDMSRKETFTNIEGWLKTLRDNCDENTNLSIILVGAKNDIAKKEVSMDELKSFAEQHNLPYFVCATISFSDRGCEQIFNKVISLVGNHDTANDEGAITDFGERPEQQTKKKMCAM